MMDIDEIKRVIPHRYPFLLVDRVIECDMESRIVGIKNVTTNEPFFQGHFPEYPIMPGVLIIEALAQVACILALKTLKWERKTVTIYSRTNGNSNKWESGTVFVTTRVSEVQMGSHLFAKVLYG